MASEPRVGCVRLSEGDGAWLELALPSGTEVIALDAARLLEEGGPSDPPDVDVVVVGIEQGDGLTDLPRLVTAVHQRPVVVVFDREVDRDAFVAAIAAGAVDVLGPDDRTLLPRILLRETLRDRAHRTRFERYRQVVTRLEAALAAAETPTALLDVVAQELALALDAPVAIDLPPERLPLVAPAPTTRWPPGVEVDAGAVRVAFPVPLSEGRLRIGVERGLDPEARHLLDHATAILADGLHRWETRLALRERARELTTLHQLAADLARITDLRRLCEVVAQRLVQAMRFPESARVEVVVDEHHLEHGATGSPHAALERQVRVGGELRGRLAVIYVDEVAFLDPEEGDLLASVAELVAGWLQRQVTEVRLRAMFDNQLDAVAFVDDAMRIVDANPALEALLDAPKRRVIGSSVADLYAGDDDLPFADLWGRFLTVGSLSGEFAARRSDGRIIQVELRAVARVLPDLHLIVVREVTDRRRIEAALRASERRFRNLAEHSADAIFLQRLVPERRFEYVNPTLARWLGHTREEIYARPELLLDAITPEDRERLWTALSDEGEGVEIDLRRPDGSMLRLQVRGIPVRDDDGTLVGVHGVAADVTRAYREREALREAVEHQRQLNELKTGFVQAVSHELRTPLTTVVGFCELLLERDLEGAERRRYLERIAGAATKLQRLVDDVLDLDRLERPGGGLRTDPVDLAALVGHVAEGSHLPSHQLVVELDPVRVLAEAPLLERVIDNLLVNAYKHTPQGTTIWVRTEPPGRLIIEDDGPGVPVRLHRRIFEPFEQGPDQLQAHSPGTGIGLSLVQRIVRLHGGEVSLSDRPGGGARFVVDLPPAQVSAAPAP